MMSERGAIFRLGKCAGGEPRGDDEPGTQSQEPTTLIICRLQLEGPRLQALPTGLPIELQR